MSIVLVALKPLLYAGHHIAPGELFEAQSEHDAHLLTTVGFGLPPEIAEDLPAPPDPDPVIKRGRGRPRKVS